MTWKGTPLTEQETRLIFHWNGCHFGFLNAGYLFDAGGEYVGWQDGPRLWRKDGEYLGELHAENYVLRCRSRPHPRRRGPKFCPVPPPDPMVAPVSRLRRAPLPGFDDALDRLA